MRIHDITYVQNPYIALVFCVNNNENHYHLCFLTMYSHIRYVKYTLDSYKIHTCLLYGLKSELQCITLWVKNIMDRGDEFLTNK